MSLVHIAWSLTLAAYRLELDACGISHEAWSLLLGHIAIDQVGNAVTVPAADPTAQLPLLVNAAIVDFLMLSGATKPESNQHRAFLRRPKRFTDFGANYPADANHNALLEALRQDPRGAINRLWPWARTRRSSWVPGHTLR